MAVQDDRHFPVHFKQLPGGSYELKAGALTAAESKCVAKLMDGKKLSAAESKAMADELDGSIVGKTVEYVVSKCKEHGISA